MQPDQPSGPGAQAREQADPAAQPPAAGTQPPPSDSDAAGGSAPGAPATPAQAAMKQTSKTDHETGSR